MIFFRDLFEPSAIIFKKFIPPKSIKICNVWIHQLPWFWTQISPHLSHNVADKFLILTFNCIIVCPIKPLECHGSNEVTFKPFLQSRFRCFQIIVGDSYWLIFAKPMKNYHKNLFGSANHGKWRENESSSYLSSPNYCYLMDIK